MFTRRCCLKQQASALDDTCQGLEIEIHALIEEQSKLEAEVSEEGDLRQRVKYLSDQLRDPIFDVYAAWTNEMNIVDAYAHWLTMLRAQAKLKTDGAPSFP